MTSDVQTPPPTPDGLTNSPELRPGSDSFTRSIKDADQARRVVKSLLEGDRDRQTINGRIMAKYNAERPYKNAELEAEGLKWRSNFTTKPLPQMIEKVAPRFVEAVQGLKYLTNASLPESMDGAAHKTDVFRNEITTTCRARKGWRILIEDIAMENALFGFTIPAVLDEFTWFPKHFRQDEFFLPKGTSQLVDSAQVVVFKEVYLPHELFKEIDDQERAADLGWNIENTTKAINEAAPENVRSQFSDWSRVYEDMRRELNLGYSFENSAKVITVYSLLAVEVNGKVSHWRLAGDALTEVYHKDERFESMSSVMSFYSFQKGNGKMHGSKGIGREIYELAGILDRCRNEVVDRLVMSGKTFIQADEKMLKRFKMSVVGNAILVAAGFNVLEQKIDGNVEGFLKLDDYLGMLVDQLIGAVSPRVLKGERVTKAQVDLFASREEEGKDSRISRFLEQFASMMSLIQQRLCDPDTVEKDAKEMQKRLLKVMTRDELNQLAAAPVASTIADLTPIQRQQMVALATENAGNPLYNQRELQKRKITALIDAQTAEALLLPEEDPTIQAEQSRLQQLELQALTAGQPVPVSPRDNHKIHLQMVIPLMLQTAQGIHEGTVGTAVLEALAAHANEHIQRALQLGAKPAEYSAESAQVKKVLGIIEELKRMDAEAEALATQRDQLEGGQPPSADAGGVPPGVPPEQMA
jgi:hypothetical protein